MTSYRPICDVWILGRPKLKDGVKYYGAYPSGFLHRARQLLGVGLDDTVLHVCAGQVRNYLYKGLGENDLTLDLDPATLPDYVMDARAIGGSGKDQICIIESGKTFEIKNKKHIPYAQTLVRDGGLNAILIDRPYTKDDATHYKPGPDRLPKLNDLVKNCLSMVKLGGRVGVLDYMFPHPGKWGQEVAVIGVTTGRNNRMRVFTVFERTIAYKDVK